MDSHPVPIERYRIGPHDRTLTLYFWAGVPPCSVLDRVEVDYLRDVVRVGIYVGRDASAGDVACIEIAKLYKTRIELREELDGRRIDDVTKDR